MIWFLITSEKLCNFAVDFLNLKFNIKYLISKKYVSRRNGKPDAC